MNAISDTQAAAAVVAAARTAKDAAFQNVAACALFALQKTVLAEEGKAQPLPKVVQRLRALQAQGGTDYKTASRHISFAIAARKMVAAKFTDHKRIKALATAEDVEAALKTVTAFLRDMGCRSAADVERWAKGDGTALTDGMRKELLRKPAPKAKEAGAGGAEGDMIAAMEEAFSAGVNLEQVEAALAWLEAKRRAMVESAAKALEAEADEVEELAEAA